MHRIIPLFIPLLFIGAAPEQRPHEEKLFQEKAREVFRSCAQEDYSNQKIIPVSDLTSESYDYFWFYSIIGRHYIGEDSQDMAESPETGGFSPLYLIDELIDDYSYIWEGLGDYAKVSYSRCLTSKLLRYSLDNNKKWYIEDTDDFMLKGYGCCRHFSRLSKWILTKIGVISQIVCSRHHAFVQVYAEGHWYSIEPQSHNSTFYYHGAD